jgi:hypothetical protein
MQPQVPSYYSRSLRGLKRHSLKTPDPPEYTEISYSNLRATVKHQKYSVLNQEQGTLHWVVISRRSSNTAENGLKATKSD